MRLTWRQIEAFRAIMLSGTITRAAEFLHVSQPAVSILLSNIEAELGYKLFRRERGRLVPTGEAEALYPEVERAFVGLDDISLAANAIGRTQAGVLRFVTMPVFAGPLLSELVAEFVRAHPDVSIVYEVQPRLTILNWISTGRCDLAISADSADHPGISIRPLARGEVVCVVPRDHPLARKRQVSASDLDGHDLICLPPETRTRRQLDQLLENSGSHPRRRVETRTSQALWQLVERGVGVGVVASHALSGTLAEHVTVRPFRPLLRSDAIILLPRNKPPTKVAVAFCTHIETFSGKLEQERARTAVRIGKA